MQKKLAQAMTAALTISTTAIFLTGAVWVVRFLVVHMPGS